MFNLVNIANAQSTSNVILKNPGIKVLMEKIVSNIVTPVIGVIFLLAFVIFVYGIVMMIANQEDTEARTNGKNSILWGVIGMFIMLSAFGIIRLISNSLGVPDPFL